MAPLARRLQLILRESRNPPEAYTASLIANGLPPDIRARVATSERGADLCMPSHALLSLRPPQPAHQPDVSHLSVVARLLGVLDLLLVVVARLLGVLDLLRLNNGFLEKGLLLEVDLVP
jgi:hypothetical protein